ncbi:hypothetical protein CPI40_07345 [Moraxella catarrhalis]|uniref:Lipoprotein n=1 Tax=Moraxella catarrhalis TaxID=480 RepID=A0A198WZT6_MORCA|nr:hypothetical protein [Moraxella catarrhalis]MPW64773.1 hypothetical protein [Moraxella catarrhalis]MPW74931.1 hypothetical protein [Moraxella catarrhalis]MPX18630.1 hypothetical protein [Moraxella catarrhalis]MPX28526.1 hypothetical protein [Moraxella catarrhalis]OAV02540.1 hypothetical protein AO380_1923 [Moraxella catarrhalis]
MKLKAIATLGALALLLQACATPHVVQTKKITDNELTCSQIKSEIAEAEEFEKKARAERKVTGKNVAAALFFLPALIGTYSNTEEAINAAKERQALLTDLYSKKNCQ